MSASPEFSEYDTNRGRNRAATERSNFRIPRGGMCDVFLGRAAKTPTTVANSGCAAPICRRGRKTDRFGRTRNACKRKWRRYRKPQLPNQGHRFGCMTHGRTCLDRRGRPVQTTACTGTPKYNSKDNSEDNAGKTSWDPFAVGGRLLSFSVVYASPRANTKTTA
ncbi:hypothetical protein L596_024464 [Steinernema carpocapsae]|uniref:HTH myb-type domain-containing protein n=1 Tax=Steinernema carpocapsae TaxID=34508 RepID=A0A4V5ZZQ7_STECR|nr:hypothetical protein L596_024464 [Steinernema carpocapsae]